MLEYSGEEPAAAFYHEAVKRVWFCFSLSEEARASLGPSSLSLAGSPEADEAAFELLFGEACDGEPMAMYEVGLLTIAGCGVGADVDAGMIWLDEAAEQGLPDAQYALGDIYAKGIVVPTDLAEALEWFRSAAEEDHEDAEARIADLLEALAHLQASAELGHADAQYRWGVMTFAGRAVARDELRGRAWIKAAAEQGHEAAIDRLHFYDEVLPALRRQAACGEPEAQFELARQLMMDEAIPQDIPEAIGWLKRAARQGHEEACAFLGTATAWDEAQGLLEELRHSAEAGEAWAVEALKHLPAGLGG